MDRDTMLKKMCRVELNQADIKAICKLRALPPACLQSRTLLQHNFLSDTGIEKAVATLDPREVLCLHLLNAAGREEDLEFFTEYPLSTLNRFDRFGCATGTVKYINFPKIRSYLLELIANCRAGVWYRTDSLIAYLKKHNPAAQLRDTHRFPVLSRPPAESAYGTV